MCYEFKRKGKNYILINVNLSMSITFTLLKPFNYFEHLGGQLQKAAVTLFKTIFI